MKIMNKKLLVATIFSGLLLSACGYTLDSFVQWLPEQRVHAQQSTSGYIDTHVHLDGIRSHRSNSGLNFIPAAEVALEKMDQLGIEKSLIMPPPQTHTQHRSYDYSQLLPVVKTYPARFGFLAGGGTLNPLIHQSGEGKVSSTLRKRFKAKALDIAKSGAAGFGEMTALHLSFNPRHPYLAVSPDHQLFKDLADIAAQYQMPIDLHMEAVKKDMPLPSGFGSNNPSILPANIPAFERLLSHNRKAKIVWVHVGWDNTGHMDVDLLRRLLKTHPNLYMSFKVLNNTRQNVLAHRPVDSSGAIRPGWLQLFKDYPERFLMGADEFFGPPQTFKKPPSTATTVQFLKQLPADLAKKISRENALKVYRW